MVDSEATPDRSLVLPALAAATLAGAFGLIAGPIAAPAGLAVAAVAASVGPGAAILAAHVAAVVVFGAGGVGTGIDPITLLAFETALAPLIAMPIAGRASLTDAAVAWLVAVGLAAVVVIAASSTDGLWPVAATLLAAAALGSYGLHRFELVTLGLVADAEPGGDR
ncbi:hypothetical protein [Halobaculum roseum]|uniref:DUF8163 domain-containing protein n=1 Tax=Halobaculum roseum TaxID=2175149 RepID=A0ABD5MJL1_9EURY|nr:hypothetical protein [Halobaculum roseum]QZY03443.1 hypothetical protein K6T36_04540 [Halobaculum roseum]